MDDTPERGIPTRVGRYTVDRLLGSGAMGFVYLGKDPELDRPVAIKTVRDLKMDDDALKTFLERFKNEARAAARLHHPNIVQVYDVGEEPEIGPYLVFEYVAGTTLKNVIVREGALSPERVVRLATEMADALTLAHDGGIIHRDIKPDNLLVTPDGATKLADFGVARVPNASLTREGQFLGTPCYAAPETLAEGRYGPHSDIFSFAAVLYEVVTGRRAFPGQEAVAVAHKVLHDEPTPPREIAEDPADVPQLVEDVLLRGLSKDPDERYQSAADLSEALLEAYSAAGMVSLADAPRPPSRRFQIEASAEEDSGRSGLPLVLLLIGLAMVGIVLFTLLSEPDEPSIEPNVMADAGTEISDVTDAGADVALDVSEATDASEDVTEVDSGAQDAADDVSPDVPEEAEMTPHEREEAAKDALDRARAALFDQDFAAARASLAEARRLDPGNSDIEGLERLLAEDEANASAMEVSP